MMLKVNNVYVCMSVYVCGKLLGFLLDGGDGGKKRGKKGLFDLTVSRKRMRKG